MRDAYYLWHCEAPVSEDEYAEDSPFLTAMMENLPLQVTILDWVVGIHGRVYTLKQERVIQ